jgi:hypothetical protein
MNMKIDIEPEWKGLIPQFVDWIKNGDNEQSKIAIDHLNKMAVLCDTVRQYQKGYGGKTCPLCNHEG